MHQGFAGLMLSRTHVELPAVPGAGDDAALQFAFAEGTTLMRTDTIECIDCSRDIEQGHNPFPGDAFLCRSWGKIVNGDNGMPVGHFASPNSSGLRVWGQAIVALPSNSPVP
jgi:hypothetical protein